MGDGRGPWKMGDSFWPISETHCEEWIRSKVAMSGMRPAADQRRKEQQERHLLGDVEDTQPVPEAENTCFDTHPGYCKQRDEHIAADLLHIVDELHAIRPFL